MLEIIIPLRNPGEVMVRTIDSLLGQQRRDFSVLISDNHSSSGQMIIESSMEKLAQAGLSVRLIRPPMELQRVEHWNWAHFQSKATWLKPLFVGDWLEPEYISCVLREIEANPQCRYLYCGFFVHREANDPSIASIRAAEADFPFSGRFITPSEMQQKVLRFGMQFGPPSVATYRREAFLSMGGYPTTLPICADSLLFCSLAARLGGTGFARRLGNFYLHDTRFSIGLKSRQDAVFSEKITFLIMLVYQAFTEKVRLPYWGIFRMALREIRARLREKFHHSAP